MKIPPRPPRADDPPFEWFASLEPLGAGLLRYSFDLGLDDEVTERHLALAMVSEKEIAKRLAAYREKPIFELIERRAAWAIFDRLPPRSRNELPAESQRTTRIGRLVTSMLRGGTIISVAGALHYEYSERLVQSFRDVYAEHVTGRYNIWKRLLEIAHEKDASAVDDALRDVGVRPATLSAVLSELAR